MAREQFTNVLINAYAVSPNWGSEPGMAWNWIINLAEHCNVFVITEGEWRDEILSALSNHPLRDNIHFYFNPVSNKVRTICWNQGDWRFYWYYRKWQRKTLDIARQIVAEHKIDIVHHLNMIGFREPGYLWKIKNIPYVWGPIGGLAHVPTAYLAGCGLKLQLFYRLKNFITDMQLRFSPRVRAAAARAYMLAATSDGSRILKKVYRKDVPTLNETGCYVINRQSVANVSNDCFKLLWVGRFIPTKRLDIALKSIAKVKDKYNVRLDIVGPFQNNLQKIQIENEIDKLGLKGIAILHGRVENSKVHEMMRNSDVFLFTSLMEGTPHVILEAIQNSLPVICFDTCGQGDVVNDQVGIKIPLTTPNQSIDDFANAILTLCQDRERLQSLKSHCRHRQEELKWENKINQMLDVYNKLII